MYSSCQWRILFWRSSWRRKRKTIFFDISYIPWSTANLPLTSHSSQLLSTTLIPSSSTAPLKAIVRPEWQVLLTRALTPSRSIKVLQQKLTRAPAQRLRLVAPSAANPTPGPHLLRQRRPLSRREPGPRLLRAQLQPPQAVSLGQPRSWLVRSSVYRSLL